MYCVESKERVVPLIFIFFYFCSISVLNHVYTDNQVPTIMDTTTPNATRRATPHSLLYQQDDHPDALPPYSQRLASLILTLLLISTVAYAVKQKRVKQKRSRPLTASITFICASYLAWLPTRFPAHQEPLTTMLVFLCTAWVSVWKLIAMGLFDKGPLAKPGMSWLAFTLAFILPITLQDNTVRVLKHSTWRARIRASQHHLRSTALALLGKGVLLVGSLLVLEYMAVPVALHHLLLGMG